MFKSTELFVKGYTFFAWVREDGAWIENPYTGEICQASPACLATYWHGSTDKYFGACIGRWLYYDFSE